MVSELTVIIKDSEKTLKTKFLPYEKYYVDEKDPFIFACIQQTKDNFDGEPTDITINIRMDIQ